MPAPLFVYGTLRDPDLLAAVLGRALRPGEAEPAVAPGFRTTFYPGRIYPALIRAAGGTADGLLLLALSPFEHDLLDAFEGTEYQRGVVPVILDQELHEAVAYFPSIAVAGDDPWSLEHWQVEHKARVLGADAAEAGKIRRKLIAIRPH